MPDSVQINISRTDVIVMVYSSLPTLSLSLRFLNKKLYLLWSEPIKNTLPSYGPFAIFFLCWCINPIFGELFDVEDVVPTGKFHGFIDVVKTQLEIIVGLSFALFHIHKTSDSMI